MTKERDDLILERLAAIEAKVNGLTEAKAGLDELKKDLTPLTKQAFQIMLHELGQVETGFQLEDIFELLRRVLRSIKNMTYVLDQLENMIDLWRTMEPLLKFSVPAFIEHLDKLEQRGVFRTYGAMLEVRAKVAEHYGPEDLAAMGDSFVLLIGMLKQLSTPEMMDFMNRMVAIPAGLKLDECKPCGPLGLISALGSKEAKEGLGVLMELTKAMGKLKGPGSQG